MEPTSDNTLLSTNTHVLSPVPVVTLNVPTLVHVTYATSSLHDDAVHVNCITSSLSDEEEALQVSWAQTEYAHIGLKLKELLGMIQDNVDFLDNITNFSRSRPTSYMEVIYPLLQTLLSTLHVIRLESLPVAICSSLFDVSPSCKGNGFRSLLTVLLASLIKIEVLLVTFTRYRAHSRAWFYLSASCLTEFSDYSDALRTVSRMMTLAAQLTDRARKNNSLFVPYTKTKENDNFKNEIENMSRDSFFGPCVGFYYAGSTQSLVKFVGLALAGYSHGHEHASSIGKGLSALAHSALYLFSPIKKGKRIVAQVKSGSMEFMKEFWSLLDTTAAKHIGKVNFI